MATYKFTLRDAYGTVTFDTAAVKNWDSIKSNLTRNTTYKGIYRSFTNTFEFVKDIRERIIRLFDDINYGGADAELYLTIEIGNDNKERSSYRLFGERQEYKADFSKIDIDELTVKLNFIDSGFQEKILSRDDVKVNYNTYTSIDGQEIAPFTDELKTINLPDRTILFDSFYDGIDEQQQSVSQLVAGATINYTPLPLTLKYKSDENVKYITSFPNTDINSASNYFYLISDKDRLINLDISLDFTMFGFGINNDINIDVSFVYYIRDVNNNPKGGELISTLSFPEGLNSYNISFTKNVNLDVAEGDSIGLIFSITVTRGLGAADVFFNYWFSDINNTVRITSTEYFDATQAQCIYPHELFSRLGQIYTGEEMPVYSTVFGRTELGYEQDGEWAYLVALNGKMIRSFPFDNQPFNTSLKEAFTAYDSVINLIAFIEIVGGVPRLRIEKYEDYFDFANVKSLGSNVREAKRKLNNDNLFTEIICGQKDYEYEEVNGVNSFAGEFIFTTPLKIKDKKYNIKSPWRMDDYGVEFPRRLQFGDNPSVDTRYDKDNYLIDAKLFTPTELNVIRDENFDVVENIFNPQFAYNLRISPKRNLLRHGNIIKSGLLNKTSNYLRFVKGASNAELITRLTTESVNLVEKDDILISDLDNALYIAELIGVETPMELADFEEILINPKIMLNFVYKNSTIYGFVDDIEYDIDSKTANIELLRINR